VGVGVAARVAVLVAGLVADPVGLIAGGLPVDEHALVDQLPALGPDPVVVPGAGRQPAWLGAVGHEVDLLVADSQAAGLLGIHEAGPGEVGLEPERAVEL